jgi:hypothetical protein
MSTRKSVSGLRRIVLINSGKYDYAEIDFDRPFQIVGGNALGKTALISTLQYLYVDNQTHMSFGSHALDESRRFFFSSDTSYILFELETATGRRVAGARGLGAGHGFELQRFHWRGEYRRELFSHPNGTIKRWAEVEPELSTQDSYARIGDTAEMRRLLCLPTADSHDAWGIVPLQDASDFAAFRQTFQRLLHLKDIKQDDLKELIAEYAEVPENRRRIDLAKDFRQQMERIENRKNSIRALESAALVTAQAREILDQESKARAEAHAGLHFFSERYAESSKHFEKEFGFIRQRNEEAEEEKTKAEKQKAAHAEEQMKALAAKLSAESFLKSLDERRKLFESYVPELESRAVENLEAEIAEITSRLNEKPGETEQSLENLIESRSAHLRSLTKAAEQNERLLVTWLKREVGEVEASRLGALVNRGVLFGVLDEDVHVLDRKILIERLRRIAAACDARGYSDEAVKIEFPPGSLKAAGEAQDPKRIREEMHQVQAEIARAEVRLDTLKNTVELRAKREGLRKQLAEQSQRLRDFRQFESDLGMEAAKREALASAESELVRVNAALEQAGKALTDAALKKQKILNDFTALNAEQEETGRLKNRYPVAPGEDPGRTPVGKAFVSTLVGIKLVQVHARVSEKCREANELGNRLKETMSRLDACIAGASFPYDTSAASSERIAAVEEQIASLEEFRQSAEHDWKALLFDARSCFRTILDSFKSIQRNSRKLSAEFAKVEFSSIEGVSLDVVANPDALNEYERQASDQNTPSLFDDKASGSRLASFTRTLESRQTLLVNDLFALNWNVRRRDGITKTYDSLDAIESTGTTVVLKVTLNLLVLRKLLLPGRANLPFYLDEVHTLDRHNFGNILDLSERLGFVGIFAAPSLAMGIRRYIHMSPDTKGRLIVTAAHRKDLVKLPDEPEPHQPETTETPHATA